MIHRKRVKEDRTVKALNARTQVPPEASVLNGTMDEKINAMYKLTLFWSHELEKSRIMEYTQLMVRPWRLIWLNILSGTSRGIGIAVGFTFFAATIIYFLQVLGALNLPIVGDYIADIVRIVQRQLELNTR
ncbi:hypothetical protein J22TS3_07340 [Paenibacillus sp. J22TS3]|nr:hypothetical protein J22TS3_07340 [Paenibacillus sp. J22TS3]